jgi:hypothetical protein
LQLFRGQSIDLLSCFHQTAAVLFLQLGADLVQGEQSGSPIDVRIWGLQESNLSVYARNRDMTRSRYATHMFATRRSGYRRRSRGVRSRKRRREDATTVLVGDATKGGRGRDAPLGGASSVMRLGFGLVLGIEGFVGGHESLRGGLILLLRDNMVSASPSQQQR